MDMIRDDRYAGLQDQVMKSIEAVHADTRVLRARASRCWSARRRSRTRKLAAILQKEGLPTRC